MPLEKWIQYGYEVVIDQGFVYLVRCTLEVGYVTSEDHGNWIQHQNVNRLPWRFVDLRKHARVLDLARAQSVRSGSAFAA